MKMRLSIISLFILLSVGCGQGVSVWQVKVCDTQQEAAIRAYRVASALDADIIMVDASEGSMKPYIVDSGYAVIFPSKVSELNVGDVIAAVLNDEYAVLHSVYKINGNYVITRGTGNPAEDDYKTYDKNLIGRALPLIITWKGAK